MNAAVAGRMVGRQPEELVEIERRRLREVRRARRRRPPAAARRAGPACARSAAPAPRRAWRPASRSREPPRRGPRPFRPSEFARSRQRAPCAGRVRLSGGSVRGTAASARHRALRPAPAARHPCAGSTSSTFGWLRGATSASRTEHIGQQRREDAEQSCRTAPAGTAAPHLEPRRPRTAPPATSSSAASATICRATTSPSSAAALHDARQAGDRAPARIAVVDLVHQVADLARRQNARARAASAASPALVRRPARITADSAWRPIHQPLPSSPRM